MKKVFITMVFAILVTLVFNNSSTASTVQFKLHVVDGANVCAMPYSGYYHITVRIYVDGNYLCSHDQDDIVNTSDKQVSFSCDGTFSQYSTYAMYITIKRIVLIPPDCQSNSSYTGLTMDYLVNQNPTVTINTN